MTAESKAFQNLRSITAAASEPVHAPVIGSGIPTKIATPQNPYFSILSLFFSAFCKSQFANLFKNLTRERENHRITRLISNKIKGTGKRLPRKQIIKFCHHGSPNAAPSGIAPRSSMIGIIEQKNTHHSLPTVSRKNCSIASIIIVPSFSYFSIDYTL